MDDLFEHLTKHIVILSIVIIVAIIFGAGYFSGQRGQWWWVLGVLGLYPLLSSLLRW